MASPGEVYSGGLGEGLLAAQFGLDVVSNGLTQGVSVASSIGYDLNEDFGNGPAGSTRTAQSPGQTGEMLMRVDVTTDFVVGTGEPLIQFHAGLGNQRIFLTSGGSYVSIGANCGPFDLQAGPVTYMGFKAEELTKGTSLFIRMNPWSAEMGRTILAASVDITVQEFQWLGLIAYVPMGAGGADPYFSAGAVIAKMVLHSGSAWNPSDFIYPAGVLNVG